MTVIVCDYCATNLATGNQWISSVKIDLCDECRLHLATHPTERRALAMDLAEERDFTQVMFPCNGCGDLVAILASDSDLADACWTSDDLAVWCPSCWESRGETEGADRGGE